LEKKRDIFLSEVSDTEKVFGRKAH
jgi:hypothetical protein